MATSMMEFKGVKPERRDIAEKVLGEFRFRIAKAMAKLGHDADNPRWVEGQLRLFGLTPYARIDFIAEVSDAQLEKDVAEAIAYIDDHFSPTMFEARAESIGIPEFAYVDVFEQLGLIPSIQCRTRGTAQ